MHGASSPLDYLQELREYSLKDHAPRITCPVLVCDAEGDDISASAPQLVDALTCQKHYIHFTAAEGAGDHCEAERGPSTTPATSRGLTACCSPATRERSGLSGSEWSGLRGCGDVFWVGD